MTRNTRAELLVGQTVRFAVPTSSDEENERFIVLELRGDRVLVEFICDMRIKPTYVHLVAELVRA